MLFLSNLIALVLAGTLVFTVIGAGERVDVTGPKRRRATLVVGIMPVLVGIPPVANTVGAIVLSLLTSRANDVAQ